MLWWVPFSEGAPSARQLSQLLLHFITPDPGAETLEDFQSLGWISFISRVYFITNGPNEE